MRAKFLALFLLCSVTLFAQDIIVQNNGNTILSKVIEIGSTEVKYKKFSNLNGPTYTIAKAEILVINYENGEKESFSNAQLSGSVVNTNNIGKRILSDDELLKVDANINNVPPKVKKLRKNAWIGGLIGVGVGAGFIFWANIIEVDEYDKSPNKYDPFDIDEPLLTYSVIGGLCIVGGAVYAGINFAKANRLLKEYNSYVHSAPIFQEKIKLSNGNMLSAGVDMLKSRNVGYTPGLGLRYNF